MEKLDVVEKLRQAIRVAAEENALAIYIIELLEKAMKEEFGLEAKFGFEQTFRIKPKKGVNTPVNDKEIQGSFRNIKSGGKKSRAIIEKFHEDNEMQKYEAATTTGTAKQVARWVIMFRELAKLKEGAYPNIDEISFTGSHEIEFKGLFDGLPRVFTNTNGIHVNSSLSDKKGNVLSDINILMHIVHGIKLLSEETTLLTAMYAEDYKRYSIKGTFKPVFVGVMDGKGDKSLRIVTYYLDNEKNHIEDRMPSSSANPYYAIIKELVGMYIGLKDKVRKKNNGDGLEVDKENYGYLLKEEPNPFSSLPIIGWLLQPAKKAKQETPLHKIPTSIEAAMIEFERGHLLRDIINNLDKKYGDGRNSGDQLHAEVLEKARKNKKGIVIS